MLKYLTYLLISEILFHPISGGAEYVELYNNSDSPITLSEIRLAKASGEKITKLYTISDNYQIEPKDYVVVTTNATWVKNHYKVNYPNKLIEVESMPIYANEKGSVIIATKDSAIIDRLDYNADMHSDLLHSDAGVALERRSYQQETQNRNNWYSASSICGYGTPTYRNSQNIENLFMDDDFHLSTEIISPDGDGYQDILEISYVLKHADLAAKVNIYDMKGRPVRQLHNNELLGAQGKIVWDGHNNNGEICHQGDYIIIIEAYNSLGTKQISKKSVTLLKK